jgi:hypothetical protein
VETRRGREKWNGNREEGNKKERKGSTLNDGHMLAQAAHWTSVEGSVLERVPKNNEPKFNLNFKNMEEFFGIEKI